MGVSRRGDTMVKKGQAVVVHSKLGILRRCLLGWINGRGATGLTAQVRCFRLRWVIVVVVVELN